MPQDILYGLNWHEDKKVNFYKYLVGNAVEHFSEQDITQIKMTSFLNWEIIFY